MARGYIGGTAAALGVGLPVQQGTSGGLLLLLVGAYLLVAFFTGRLTWLTNAISDAFGVYNAGAAAPAATAPAATQPARTTRPRTYPAGQTS